MKTRSLNSNLIGIISLIAVTVGIVTVVFGAERKHARVTEVVHDVRLLAAQAAARAAAVNDSVNEGTAVRTGNESRAELTFADQTITRLGANTVFSFGGAARTYDLGSGAILMTAPRDAGTIKISAGVATCAVSGFTGIWESHSKFMNKILFFEANGEVWLNKNPSDQRHMHSHQMLVFPPNATVLPQPQDFDVCKTINNGLLFTGFSHQLPSWPLLVEECEKQRTAPPTQLVDPTGHDRTDQSIFARPSETPPPPARPSPDGELMKQRPH
ncbi:MAG TPA: FecR domain-containing protein [Chthoniobacterales bacterium]|nr:FecR domain-containing protein [Chthoniobacterales bacterium]